MNVQAYMVFSCAYLGAQLAQIWARTVADSSNWKRCLGSGPTVSRACCCRSQCQPASKLPSCNAVAQFLKGTSPDANLTRPAPSSHPTIQSSCACSPKQGRPLAHRINSATCPPSRPHRRLRAGRRSPQRASSVHSFAFAIPIESTPGRLPRASRHARFVSHICISTEVVAPLN